MGSFPLRGQFTLNSLACLFCARNTRTLCARMATHNPLGEGASANMIKTPKELREIRRLKAKAYRDMYLLPRFVVEEDGSKRKLEAGEFDPKSQLYPLSTPISEMSDFGESCAHASAETGSPHGGPGTQFTHPPPPLDVMALWPARHRHWHVLHDDDVVWHHHVGVRVSPASHGELL